MISHKFKVVKKKLRKNCIAPNGWHSNTNLKIHIMIMQEINIIELEVMQQEGFYELILYFFRKLPLG